MIEQEWKRFASTGSIQDYLNYKCHQAGGGYGGTAASMMADKDGTGRRCHGRHAGGQKFHRQECERIWRRP